MSSSAASRSLAAAAEVCGARWLITAAETAHAAGLEAGDSMLAPSSAETLPFQALRLGRGLCGRSQTPVRLAPQLRMTRSAESCKRAEGSLIAHNTVPFVDTS